MKIKELLSTPDRWTQGWFAKIGDFPTNVDNPEATCFCLLGALSRCYEERAEPIMKIRAAIHELFPEYQKYNTPISLFNDRQTYEDIMKVVNHADV
jgi:hypothetical protein